MKLVDKFRKLGVRTNADTPEDARIAREFGAEGIGLFRTEHMFYGEGSDEPLFVLRKMILSNTPEERQEGGGRVVPVREAGHQGHARGDGRPAGHDSPAGSAAARVRAAGQGGRRPSWPRPSASAVPTCRSGARNCTKPTP